METHRYLLKENQSSDGIFQLDENGHPIEIGGNGEPLEYDADGNVLNPLPIEVICANEGGEPNTMIELSTGNTTIPLMLQFEDGELDEYLKIYTNYVRVQDKHGDFHYDLYFNLQNLFNSPFEYISTVTKQPNVLVIPDSYLYLTGDKYTNKGDHNEVDDDKMKVIKDGGELSIYGQVKTYSDGLLSDAKTIKMFTYRIYNISDDKPKFLIQKTFDITKSSLRNSNEKKVEVKFSDVLWTIDENQFEFADSSLKDDFRILNQDVVVVQPIHINCHWDKDDDNRVRTLSFDIMHDTIDFANVPMLGQYWMQARTLNCEVMQTQNVGDRVFKKPYYDHWSDSNMQLVVDENTGTPRLTLTFNEDADFNFETIYLKWVLPRGCRIMDSIDRMGGYVFSSTPMNIVADCGNAAVVPNIETSTGHIVARVKRPNRMYLGLEHSSTQRMNGYVISNLAEEIHKALLRGEKNPTLEGTDRNRG